MRFWILPRIGCDIAITATSNLAIIEDLLYCVSHVMKELGIQEFC